MNFKGKKVLVVGLGTLGGGIATVKWLVKHGAKVTVTDLRTKEQLSDSVRKLSQIAPGVKLVLSEHRERDFKNNGIVVVNPAVPRESKYLAIARKRKKLLVNDARIFFDVAEGAVIAVTGTRGKTTTTNWIAYFLRLRNKDIVAGGNSSEVALLDLADKIEHKSIPSVVELSSWQLELLPGARRAPDIAVITNLYPDHLNRYKNIKGYARAKANIFRGQDRDQKLVLNYDNPWTKFFLGLRPRSKTYFFSLKRLPRGEDGIFVKNGALFFQETGSAEEVISEKAISLVKGRGEHNIMNLMAASLAAHLSGISWFEIAAAVRNLPEIKYREEVVLERENLRVVNDSTATSPDAVVAAIRRFGSHDPILITGGTDKNLDFKPLAREIKKAVRLKNLFLLNGSATQKLIRELKKIGYFSKERPQLFEDLEKLLISVREHSRRSRCVVLFSPGAASFEKFKNEFDRGEKFNALVRSLNF